MLSWSIEETGQEISLLPIASGRGDPLLRGGEQLVAYVTATLTGREITAARDAVVAVLGREAAVDAAGVIGNFEMMNRVAEVSGIPISQQSIDRSQDLIDRLDIGGFVKR